MNQGTSRQVKRSFVTETTSGTYSETIILFMMWIFDTRREFIVQEYIPEFKAMNNEYLLDLQQCEEDENVTYRRKINPVNEKIGIKNIMRQIFDEIQPLQSGISHNSPIKIDEEGDIAYEVENECSLCGKG